MRRPLVFLHVLLFVSGIAGLGYELVWVRMFAVRFGHELPSLLAVLAAFFGGIALGAATFDGLLAHCRRPHLWYAALEFVIGSWAILSLVVIPWSETAAAALNGTRPGPLRYSAVSLVIPFVALLPATSALGATIPVMDRVISRAYGDGRWLGGLYGANTLGAVAGTLGTTFVLMPRFGLGRTLLLLAVLNLACALAVLGCGGTGLERPAPTPVAGMAEPPGVLRLYVGLCLAGLLGIGYEVVAVRVMSQILENTIYSFAAALSVYLLATSLGALGYQAAGKRRPHDGLLVVLAHGVTISCLVGILIVAHASGLYEWLRSKAGVGLHGFVAAEMGLALALFLFPCLFMGALFSHLAQGARQRSGLGKAIGVNTFGAAMAPVVFGFLILPVFGSKAAMLIAALSYLLLVTTRRPLSWLPAVVSLLLIALLPSTLVLVAAPSGGSILAYREGAMATVGVVTDSRGSRYLKVNNRFYMGDTASVFGERRQAHIPLLLHPDPHRVLFLGLGTGITAGAALDHPEINCEAVELIPEVVDLLRFFSPQNREVQQHPRMRVITADARRYVRTNTERYDVIVADLFHPARDGAGALYTREHFLAVRERLAGGGLFCQWLPLYQLDVTLFRAILRTFLDVFPHTRAFLAIFNVSSPGLALVATDAPVFYTAEWYTRRVRSAALAQALEEDGLGDGLALLGTHAAGREDLATFAGRGPLETDDRSTVTFEAPRFVYGEPQPPWTLLAQLLTAARLETTALLAEDGTPFSSRLQAFLRARNSFLSGEMLDAQGLRAESREAWLSSVRTSPDFLTGYARLLSLAARLANVDEAEACRLLSALAAANPGRPEAPALLRSLEGATKRHARMAGACFGGAPSGAINSVESSRAPPLRRSSRPRAAVR